MDFVPDVAKHGTYADFYDLDGGGVAVKWRDTCAYGHPTAQAAHTPCPRCGEYARVYYCADVHCDGMVTSLAHETVCPRRPPPADPADTRRSLQDGSLGSRRPSPA
jgi:hypothetical protein